MKTKRQTTTASLPSSSCSSSSSSRKGCGSAAPPPSGVWHLLWNSSFEVWHFFLLFVPLLPSLSSAQPTHTTAVLSSNRVSITVSGGERIMSANGLPDHTPGQFPNRGNPNSISAQNYNFH